MKRIVISMCLMLGLATASLGSMYDQLLVFGDSLSDTGNVFAATGGGFPFNAPDPATGALPLFPNPAYLPGRFTNGPAWIETLASGLELQVNPSVPGTGGTNYAYGGAESGNGLSLRSTPNLGLQVDLFTQDLINGIISPTPNTLVSLWIGGNDFLNPIINSLPPANPGDVVNNVEANILRLANFGLNSFFVPNLPPLGQSPLAVGNAALSGLLDNLALQYNGLLAQGLAELRATTNLSIIELDVHSLVSEVLADPAAFGFTNSTGTAFDTAAYQLAYAANPNVDPTQFLAANPNEYVFMDGEHPTARSHAILGAAALQEVIPEPSGLVVWSEIGFFGLALAAVRRKKRALS